MSDIVKQINDIDKCFSDMDKYDNLSVLTIPPFGDSTVTATSVEKMQVCKTVQIYFPCVSLEFMMVAEFADVIRHSAAFLVS